MKLLFVCTGNTCRSPMAEVAARKLGFEARSAGTTAWEGSPMADDARRALAERGFDPGPHTSQKPSLPLVAWADFVLTMEDAHRQTLSEAYPWAASWIMTLSAFGGASGDVDDPAGKGFETYRSTLERIEAYLKAGERVGWTPPRFAWAAGSDHAGLTLKQALLEGLGTSSHLDVGTDRRESCDYPDFAEAVGWLVAQGKAELGLLACGSGIGMSIAANKVPGVRAAVAWDATSARLARQHNNANVICFGERLVGPEVARDALSAFASSAFSGGRHERRVAKIALLDRHRSEAGGEQI